MPNFYSDLFATQPAALAKGAGFFSDPGKQHTSVQYARAQLDLTGGTPVDNDVWAMIPVNPNWRLVELMFSVDNVNNAATTWTVDIGLYELNGSGAIGTVIDLNLFANLVNIDATASARIDAFVEAATLSNFDRGKYLWELVNVAIPATYTEAPAEQWAICIQNNISGAVTAVSTNIVLEAYFANA